MNFQGATSKVFEVAPFYSLNFVKWQLTKCGELVPLLISISCGVETLQISMAFGHLVWKAQPLGTFLTLATSPDKIILSWEDSKPMSGIAEIRAWV